MVDLSPNLAPDPSPPRWRSRDFGGIVFDRWLPEGGGRLIRCTSPNDYEREVAGATNQAGLFTGIYLEQARRPPRALTSDALRAIDSPLFHQIVAKHGLLAYSAAVLHLRDLVSGRARSVGGLSQSKAWSIVASRYVDPEGLLEEATGNEFA